MLLFNSREQLKNYMALMVNDISLAKQGATRLISYLWENGKLFPIEDGKILHAELSLEQERMLQLGIEIGKILSEAKAQRQSTY
jgi:hypothetical protein